MIVIRTNKIYKSNRNKSYLNKHQPIFIYALKVQKTWNGTFQLNIYIECDVVSLELAGSYEVVL